jgi:hypothetical protein
VSESGQERWAALSLTSRTQPEKAFSFRAICASIGGWPFWNGLAEPDLMGVIGPDVDEFLASA